MARENQAGGIRRRTLLGLGALALLPGCFGFFRPLPPRAGGPMPAVGEGPPEIVLVTVLSRGIGRHSALILDAGGPRVVYDPAGGWRDPDGQTAGDLRLEMTAARLDAWLTYHTRRGRTVVLQAREVPQATAVAAIRLAMARPPEFSGRCTLATAEILSALPGFEALHPTVLPRALMEDFGALPGVTTRLFRSSGAVPPPLAEGPADACPAPAATPHRRAGP